MSWDGPQPKRRIIERNQGLWYVVGPARMNAIE